MSRKHYVETARLIADEVEIVRRADGTAAQRLVSGQRCAIQRLAVGLADQYKQDNSRFDRQRFYSACGLNEQGRIER